MTGAPKHVRDAIKMLAMERDRAELINLAIEILLRIEIEAGAAHPPTVARVESETPPRALTIDEALQAARESLVIGCANRLQSVR